MAANDDAAARRRCIHHRVRKQRRPVQGECGSRKSAPLNSLAAILAQRKIREGLQAAHSCYDAQLMTGFY